MRFDSRLSKGEKLAALLYLPVHMLLLPTAVVLLAGNRGYDEAQMNFIVYAVGAVFMLFALRKFFRRDFDPLCDRLPTVILQVLGSYLITMGLNSLLALLLLKITGTLNPNNESVVSAAMGNSGVMKAIAVFLAPIVEESMFRAGIFGTLREKSRVAAYVVSILAFSLYHVLGFAVGNPLYLIYALQYVPVSFMLCRCYEVTGTIWTPVFLHMMINGVSMSVIGGAR